MLGWGSEFRASGSGASTEIFLNLIAAHVTDRILPLSCSLPQHATLTLALKVEG